MSFVGGKLLLKGGEGLPGAVKKKKKKAKNKEGDDLKQEQAEEQLTKEGEGGPSKPKPADPTAVSILSGKRYEEEFDLETARAVTGKQRSTPWGATVRQAPEILHGYSRKVTGATAEERLDMRAATKADRYCK